MDSRQPKLARLDAHRFGLHLKPGELHASMFVIPSHAIAWRCAYSGEHAQSQKLNDACLPGEAGSRRKLAPHNVDFALRVVPRLHELPNSLKDAVRLARAMTRVVVGYAPIPALPGFPDLFTRLKEVYDLVVSVHSALAAGSTPDAEWQVGQALELLSSFNLLAK
jgi:hypothetical protein